MKYRILIADDDTDAVETLQDFLELQGFETLVSYEGIRTIETAHKQSPDLILLDILMPAGSGNTVLQNLRSHPDTMHIPVIVLTGFKKPNLDQEVKAAGAQDIIWKPPDPKLLLAKIRALLPAPEKAAP